MSKLRKLSLMVALAALYSNPAMATVAYGDLNNFDTVNNTGHKCYGFEIELDGVRSTEVTYTYDWNHYGAPIIREDISDPLNPKTFIRYTAKTKGTNGLWLEFTNPENPASPIGPTDGHLCTDPTQNAGCEHFGVGYYGTPTAVKYNWLVDDGSGGGVISTGEVVSVATPVWTPVLLDPGLPPDPVANPVVQVIAAIPAPEVPIPPSKQFGDPSWVKVIKTTTHNNHNVQLIDLVGADRDADGRLDWTNGEPDEVESEWYLLQVNNGNNAAKGLLPGGADDLPGNDETVTRRYEFHTYAGSQATIDDETGEAMCDAVGADNSHGSGIVGVTKFDPNNPGETYTALVDCSTEVVIGAYTGAQMAGFDPVAALGLIDHIENGNVSEPYTNRTVVIGGNTPYTTEITSGALPTGLSIDSATGVLSGTPTTADNFLFTVKATDYDGIFAIKSYAVTIVDSAAPPPANRAPVANDQLKSVAEDSSASIALSATDADGDPLTYSVADLPANGILSGSPPNLTYAPAANFYGTDSFTFKANDGQTNSNLATVNIFVTAVNDPPVAVADSATTRKNVPVTTNVLANDTDVDPGDVLSVISVITATKPARGTAVINGNGTITYTPKRNWAGRDSYRYTISDGNGGTSAATVTVNVTKK